MYIAPNYFFRKIEQLDIRYVLAQEGVNKAIMKLVKEIKK